MGFLTKNIIPEMFECWLRENTSISESSIEVYKRCIVKFLKEYDNLYRYENYINFAIKYAIKKRCYSNKYALIHFVKYYVTDYNLKLKIIDGIKQLPIKMKDCIKYIDLKPLSDEEISNVINNLTVHKHKIMAYIMVATGLRVGDVLRIPYGGIYTETEDGVDVLRIKTIQKGNKFRITHIWNEDVIKVIIDYISWHEPRMGYHFLNERKKIVRYNPDKNLTNTIFKNYKDFWMDLKTSLQTCNIDRRRFALHSFRRNFAKHVWNKTRDMELFQKVMGHQNIETSIRYLRSEGMDTSKVMREIQMG